MAAAPIRPAAPVPPADWPSGADRLLRPWRLFNTIALYPAEVYERPIVERRFGGRPHFLVNDPEGVGHVLQANQPNYVKAPKVRRMLTPLLGHSVITADGEEWQRQRRAIAPAFRVANVAGFVPMFAAEAALWAARWERFAAAGRPVDMADEMQLLTLRLIGRTMFGAEMAGLDAVLDGARRYLAAAGLVEMLIGAGLPERLGPPLNRRFARRAGRPLRRLVAGLLEGEPQGLLGLLMRARAAEPGRPAMSAREVEDLIATVLMAGHATTAMTLCFLWYLLALAPAVRTRVEAELAAVLQGRAPEAADLERLAYCRMVIEETLRLYPVIPAIGHEALAADRVCGLAIPAGARVTVSPWLVQRHRRLWAQPELFDPERFAPERREAIPRFAHIPFGGGPRVCVGASFAMSEMLTVLAVLGRRFAPVLPPGQAVEVVARGHLQPRGGLPMLIERR
ncbi:MAG: cytochrome P450 [Dongiaceae bacterium]